MAKIGKAGPHNAAILDTEKGFIEKDDSRILMLDKDLVDKMKFVKEGEFVEKKGKATLKLIGNIIPVDKVEVVRKVKENLLKQYPLSALEVVDEVKKKLPIIKQGFIWKAIKENDLKNNQDYAAFNFRNKKQEDDYKNTGRLAIGIPTIYKQKAVDFLVNVLKINNN